jgi:glycosyltransferase involved in cell wall biosynthesis
VVVVPSIIDSRGETEGMPTVILEAMAAGKRVVASDVDGIPDVVRHGRNGWLVKPRDPISLAAGLCQALRDPDDTRILEARKTAEHYAWPALSRRYADCLRNDARIGV